MRDERLERRRRAANRARRRMGVPLKPKYGSSGRTSSRAVTAKTHPELFQSVCGHCNGTGKIVDVGRDYRIEHTCAVCHGSGKGPHAG